MAINHPTTVVVDFALLGRRPRWGVVLALAAAAGVSAVAVGDDDNSGAAAVAAVGLLVFFGLALLVSLPVMIVHARPHGVVADQAGIAWCVGSRRTSVAWDELACLRISYKQNPFARSRLRSAFYLEWFPVYPDEFAVAHPEIGRYRGLLLVHRPIGEVVPYRFPLPPGARTRDALAAAVRTYRPDLWAGEQRRREWIEGGNETQSATVRREAADG